MHAARHISSRVAVSSRAITDQNMTRANAFPYNSSLAARQDVYASHPWTAWSCRWMSGCGSRCTARTGCRRTERCLMRRGTCPRRPAEHTRTHHVTCCAACPGVPSMSEGPEAAMMHVAYMVQYTGHAAKPQQQAEALATP
jgi:hypothetical protein